MTDQPTTEKCRRCGTQLWDFCGVWLDADDREECGDRTHRPATSEAERIGFTGYTGCCLGECPVKQLCLASGECSGDNLQSDLDRHREYLSGLPAEAAVLADAAAIVGVRWAMTAPLDEVIAWLATGSGREGTE